MIIFFVQQNNSLYLSQISYRLKKLFFIFLLLFIGLAASAQQSKIDSLQAALKKNISKTGYTADTTRYRIIANMAKQWQGIDTDSALYYHTQAKDIALRLKDDLRQAEALNGLAWDAYALGDSEKSETLYNEALVLAGKYIDDPNKKKKRDALIQQSGIFGNLGILYGNKGEYDEALKYYEKALKTKRQIGDKRGEGITSNNLGNLYLDLCNYPQALSSFYISLKRAREIRHTSLEASALSNIGIVHMNMKEYSKALKYFREALELANRTGNVMNQSACHTNIGIIYHEMKDLDTALAYYQKALEYDVQLGNLKSQANNFMNIGAVYYDLKQYATALQYYERAKEQYAGFESEYGIASAMNSIGMALSDMKQFKKAEAFLLGSQKKAAHLHALDLLKANHQYLSLLYEETHQPEKALYHYRQHIVFRDSIFNEENTKAKIQREVQFNYDVKAAADSVKFAQEKEVNDMKMDKQAAEIRARRNQQYALYGGLALVLVFAGFMFNRFRVTQKQKRIIEQKEKETSEQKHIIEEKHREITDSINYAKRLQEAILPPASFWEQQLPRSFILYKPKDIVAGDFYFMEQSGDKLIFAAADSTGHGVPGAMVSVVCSNALTRAVKEFHLTHPGKILDKVRELVMETFSKSESDVKDGMDISLCVLDKKTGTLEWAGANNPLWIFRPGENQEYQFTELRPDKQPVGKTSDPQPFSSHKTETRPGDMVYLFTDGYADQFGGEKGKKFKSANMRELIITVLGEDIGKQKETLRQAFEKWKGDLEQVDDVCVIGIRL